MPETVNDLLFVHVVQLVELSMEKHKLNLEKVQLENQLEAEQEYIVHKLQKQVGSMCMCMCGLAAQSSCTVLNWRGNQLMRAVSVFACRLLWSWKPSEQCCAADHADRPLTMEQPC